MRQQYHDERDLIDPADRPRRNFPTNPVEPTPVEPIVPVEQEVIPEHLRSKEPKTKFILIAIALVAAAIWVMTQF